MSDSSEGGPDDGDREAADPETGQSASADDRIAEVADEISAETDDEEGEWRFALDEVGEDAEEMRVPIEPESPDLEHVAFVLVGVVATLLLLFFGI